MTRLKRVLIIGLFLTVLNACGGKEKVAETIEQPIKQKEKMEESIQKSVDLNSNRFDEAEKTLKE